MQRGEQARAETGERACTGVDVALTRVFELLGKRWTGLIVAVLTQRAAYYSDLRRSLPKISERMLSDRLSELVDAGLVVREVDEGPPLRVTYRLTEAGLGLGPALNELGLWAETYLLGGIDEAGLLDGPCAGEHSSPSPEQQPGIC
ncbi:helix-turn-helix domain-containing protein [Streptomyces sp. SPB162]|uniref:winged helix-turn-helix transcriptional regulator n=1 Tax=Streptomyces sp. SPB162 TaxID=2940560 RepID=UPI0024053895|nr:helix-turn-helix domain-containing protein [Streptomyces sp. SPB162]MDF9814435.1 DNA-binding HxlR family transcriptional regulator [Streptomyces sp. SPB162]